MPVLQEPTAEQAYDALAADYDQLTAHHDYALWIGAITGELAQHDSRSGRLLDVGCGTGRSTRGWIDAGFDVVGLDASAAMLRHAHARLPATRFHHGDLRDLSSLEDGAFDIAACLCDVVNYVPARDLSKAFRSVADLLVPGGLLLFDANTARAYREQFAMTHVVEDRRRMLIWRGGVDDSFVPGDSATLVIEAFHRHDGAQTRWSRTSSVHQQFHHPRPTVEAALRVAGLALVDVYGQGFDATPERPLDESRHIKGLFIARRPGAPRPEGR